MLQNGKRAVSEINTTFDRDKRYDDNIDVSREIFLNSLQEKLLEYQFFKNMIKAWSI